MPQVAGGALTGVKTGVGWWLMGIIPKYSNGREV